MYFELKFKNSSELEHDLNSMEFDSFDSIQCLTLMIRVKSTCLNIGDVTQGS
jgi:hypothetical protein